MIEGERAARLFFIPAAGRRSGGGRLQACRAEGSDHQRDRLLKYGRTSFLKQPGAASACGFQAAKEPQV